MRRFFISAAGVALVGLAIASAIVNFGFGWEVGKSTSSMLPWGHDGYIWGGVSLLLDVFKIGLPIIIVTSLMAAGTSRRLRAAIVLVAALFWVPITAYSFNSAFGSALLGRTDGVGIRQKQANDGNALEKERAKLLNKKPWTAELEQWKELPSDTIAEKIEAHKVDRMWAATAECKAPNLKLAAHRGYCQTFFLLKAARDAAIQSAADHKRLVEIEGRLAGASAVTVADPQARAYADLTGKSEDLMRQAWALLLAFLLEIVPNVGPALLVMFAGIKRHEEMQPADAVAATTEPAAPEPKKPETQPEQKRKWDANAYLKQFPAKAKSKGSSLQQQQKQIVERVVEEVRSEKGVGEEISPRELDPRIRAECISAGVAVPNPEQRGKLLAPLGLHSKQGRAYVIRPRPAPRREVGQFIHA